MATEQSHAPRDAMSESERSVADGRGSAVGRVASFLPEVALLALTAYAYLQTLGMREEEGPGPAFFPRILIALLALAALFRAMQKGIAMRRGRRPRDTAEATEGESRMIPGKLVTVIALAVGYVLATAYLGWPIATFLFVVGFLYLAGRRKLLLTIPLAAVTSIGFSYVFLGLVYVDLPTGVGVFDTVTVLMFGYLGIY